MGYGLADARNYDSIELDRSLRWFELMYEPDPSRPLHTSRRTIRWEGVVRAREPLRLAGVVAVVGASAPPAGAFDRVDRVGNVWVGRWSSLAPPITSRKPNEIRVDLKGDNGQVRWIAETHDPGWNAEIDGRPRGDQTSPGNLPQRGFAAWLASVDFSVRPGGSAAWRSALARFADDDWTPGEFGILAAKKCFPSWKAANARVTIVSQFSSRSLRTGSSLH